MSSERLEHLRKTSGEDPALDDGHGIFLQTCFSDLVLIAGQGSRLEAWTLLRILAACVNLCLHPSYCRQTGTGCLQCPC